jgi:S-adenosylhomocysteine hydrolase
MWKIRMRVLNDEGVAEKITCDNEFGTLEELTKFLNTKAFDVLVRGKELISIVFKFEG